MNGLGGEAVTGFYVACALICVAVGLLLWLAEPVAEPKPVEPEKHYRRPPTPGYQGRHFATVPKRSLVPLPVRRYAAAVVAAQYLRYRLALPIGQTS